MIEIDVDLVGCKPSTPNCLSHDHVRFGDWLAHQCSAKSRDKNQVRSVSSVQFSIKTAISMSLTSLSAPHLLKVPETRTARLVRRNHKRAELAGHPTIDGDVTDVIVITSNAPRIRGGAGDGIPNARHANPNPKASTMPSIDFMAYLVAPGFSPAPGHGRQ